MDADVRDQRDGEISSGEPRHRQSDDADHIPPPGAAAAAGAVVGDSDSAGSYRHVQHHDGHTLEQPLPTHMRMQQQAYGADLNRQLLDLHHASSYASSLGNPSAQNLAAVMAAAAAANAAAAAAATETTGTSKDDVSEEERVRRRREINRNSQKRIRERRHKEMDGLKYEAQRLAADNDSLIRKVEGLTLEKADMLRQIQDLTEKWQQSIAENAWLNRENIQLRNSLQQLNSLVVAGAGAAPGAPPPATPSLTAAGSGQISAAAALAAAAAAAAGARGSTGSGGGEPGEGLPHLSLGVAGLDLPPLHGISSNT